MKKANAHDLAKLFAYKAKKNEQNTLASVFDQNKQHHIATDRHRAVRISKRGATPQHTETWTDEEGTENALAQTLNNTLLKTFTDETDTLITLEELDRLTRFALAQDEMFTHLLKVRPFKIDADGNMLLDVGKLSIENNPLKNISVNALFMQDVVKILKQAEAQQIYFDIPHKPTEGIHIFARTPLYDITFLILPIRPGTLHYSYN